MTAPQKPHRLFVQQYHKAQVNDEFEINGLPAKNDGQSTKPEREKIYIIMCTNIRKTIQYGAAFVNMKT